MPYLLLTESNTFGNPSAVGSHTAERVQSLFREVINAVLLTLSFCVHVHAYKTHPMYAPLAQSRLKYLVLAQEHCVRTHIFSTLSGKITSSFHFFTFW